MFPCPSCSSQLVRTKTSHGQIWACPDCQGHAATISILRKSVEKEFLNQLWARVWNGEGVRPRRDRRCPTCEQAMGEILEESITGPLEIDVCRSCHLFWFDLEEAEQLPAIPDRGMEDDEPELDPRVRQAMALAEIEAIRRKHDPHEIGLEPPDEWWKALATIVGLPAEESPGVFIRKPLLTWGLALLILVVSFLAFRNLNHWVGLFGLIAADPLRLDGATFFTSFFLHGGWFHLLGNLYFLLIFGDNVEDVIGRLRYGLLLVIATFAGGVAHVLGDPSSSIPVIGASGGISGIIAFYALAFPQVKVAIFFRIAWIRMSAFWAFLIWMLIQIVGSYYQVRGFGDVSFLAHLGGALAGALYWSIWRMRN
ncbi:MAG: rhomboid family intramembrane serine protease [Verrucomicrobiota bacterium]